MGIELETECGRLRGLYPYVPTTLFQPPRQPQPAPASDAQTQLDRLDDRRQQALEDICNLGCRSVGEVILALRRGEAVAQTDGMAPEQADLLLEELESIMAVYDGACDTVAS